ncbi:protein SPMIP7 [Misgurnus anguillicaudatus]|uniref:protein SPMIP7 n=1 Tax=Misgurnus anguillicaudatus TaxID=75329 RepID=UPI003CCFA580
MEGESIPYYVRFLRTPAVSSDGVSRWLCRHLNVPCERGPEGRYDFHSMVAKNRRAFSKFNPQAQPPDGNAPLAPLRDNVPLMDPCSGQLSAGAQVHLDLKIRSPFVDRVYTSSDLWVPPGTKDLRPQTPPIRPSALQYDESDHNRWNSRSKLQAAVKAKIEGLTSVQNKPFTPNGTEINMDAQLSVPDSVKKSARRFIYTSTTQRGYEDVDWDSKLPPRHKPPSTTLEKMADRVSQHSVLKRSHKRSELWQAIGSHWTKNQLRATFNPRKPISFTSPCPKSGHIPLYCGTVGSEDMDSVDNPDEDFIPLTVLRTTVPPQTPTSFRNAIPGYNGKARFDGPKTTAVNLPSVSYTAQTAGSSPDTWRSAIYRRKAPVSRMVTTVPPGNPYIHP